MAPTLEALLKSASRIGSLPDIVPRINEVIDDPRSSMDDLAVVISEDPSLSARLLKIANSALFNTPFPVDTITRALTMIGSKQLRDLVAATCIIKVFAKVDAGGLDLQAYWRHSIACGVAARVLATARREVNVERYYLAGLLHDIGQLILFVQAPDEATAILARGRAANRPLFRVERESLGYDHGEVGGRLLESWNLPPGLCQAVLTHHAPAQADDYAMEGAILHLADLFALTLFPQWRIEPLLPQLEPAAWSQVHLPLNTVGNLADIIKTQFRDALRLFPVPA